MKKYIIGGIFIAIIITTLVIFMLPKKKPTEVIFLNQSHYILYDVDSEVSMIYFTNDPDYHLINKYSAGFIENEDLSIRFIIDQFKQTKIHNENYQDITYFGYKITFSLPDITDSYYMEKLYLNLDTNGKEYRFFAGELFVEYHDFYEKIIPWTGLEGIKKESPQLSQIVIDVNEKVDINEVFIGPHQVTFFYGDSVLIIDAPDDTYIFYDTYVKIETELGVTYIPQFNYFSNYQLLHSGFYIKLLI